MESCVLCDITVGCLMLLILSRPSPPAISCISYLTVLWGIDDTCDDTCALLCKSAALVNSFLHTAIGGKMWKLSFLE